VALGKGAAVAGCVFRRGRPLIFETKLTSLPPSPYLLIPFSASDDTGHYILSYVFLRPAFLPLDPEVEENEEQKRRGGGVLPLEWVLVLGLAGLYNYVLYQSLH